MTGGHVFVREPVNRVPGLQYSIRRIIYNTLTTPGGEGGGGGGGE